MLSFPFLAKHSGTRSSQSALIRAISSLTPTNCSVCRLAFSVFWLGACRTCRVHPKLDCLDRTAGTFELALHGNSGSSVLAAPSGLQALKTALRVS